MHIPRIRKTVLSMTFIRSGGTGRDVQCPPAVAETCFEDFAAHPQQPDQLPGAELVRAVADKDLIVIAGAGSVQAAGPAIGRHRGGLFVHERDGSRQLM